MNFPCSFVKQKGFSLTILAGSLVLGSSVAAQNSIRPIVLPKHNAVPAGVSSASAPSTKSASAPSPWL